MDKKESREIQTGNTFERQANKCWWNVSSLVINTFVIIQLIRLLVHIGCCALVHTDADVRSCFIRLTGVALYQFNTFLYIRVRIWNNFFCVYDILITRYHLIGLVFVVSFLPDKYNRHHNRSSRARKPYCNLDTGASRLLCEF